MGCWNSAAPVRAPLPAIRRRGSIHKCLAQSRGILTTYELIKSLYPISAEVFTVSFNNCMNFYSRVYNYIYIYSCVRVYAVSHCVFCSQNIFKSIRVVSYEELSLGANMLRSFWLQNRLQWRVSANADGTTPLATNPIPGQYSSAVFGVNRISFRSTYSSDLYSYDQ